MPLVDDKGRLFGKVNLLDLVVFLVVVAVAGRFGYKSAMGRGAAPVGEDKVIETVMRFSPVAQPTIDVLKPGVEVFDSKSNELMGKVVEIRPEPALLLTTTEDGRNLEVRSKDRFDLYVTLRGNGRVAPNGVTMGGIEIKIGRLNFMKTALWAGQGTTWTINTAPPAR